MERILRNLQWFRSKKQCVPVIELLQSFQTVEFKVPFARIAATSLAITLDHYTVDSIKLPGPFFILMVCGPRGMLTED